MGESVRVAIEEQSQVARARRLGVELSDSVGCDKVTTGHIAIVITEICNNILKHALCGELLLRIVENDYQASPFLEVLGIDRGPGMHDLVRCQTDGYSTAGSPGQGLGAILRLSGDSDFYTVPAEGTVVMARWPAVVPAKAGREVGAVNLAKKGEPVCGDSWGIEQIGDITVIMVADGLGHGYEAAVASREAVRVFREYAEDSPKSLIERAHRALRSTRGAAVAVARIDQGAGQATFCGVGNIMGQIYTGAQFQEHLVSVNGTAGDQMGRLREHCSPWPVDGMILMCSDGLSTRTSLLPSPALALRDPSVIAAALYRDFGRGLDDATAVVVKAESY